MHKNYLRWLED